MPRVPGGYRWDEPPPSPRLAPHRIWQSLLRDPSGDVGAVRARGGSGRIRPPARMHIVGFGGPIALRRDFDTTCVHGLRLGLGGGPRPPFFMPLGGVTSPAWGSSR